MDVNSTNAQLSAHSMHLRPTSMKYQNNSYSYLPYYSTPVQHIWYTISSSGTSTALSLPYIILDCALGRWTDDKTVRVYSTGIEKSRAWHKSMSSTMASSKHRFTLLLSLLLLFCKFEQLVGFVVAPPSFHQIRHLHGPHGRGCYNPHPCRRSSSSSSSVLVAASTKEGTVLVSRPDGKEYKLAYRIVRPMTLSSRRAAPVVVLHGGPSLPADYLYPLEQAVEYRSIVFYDQIGCGRSDEPTDRACYSIDMALDDLDALLKKLGIRRFHLYGQSFGGILAYEYQKRRMQQNQFNGKNTDPVCLSCVLSSTPTSVKRVEETYDQLLVALERDPTLDKNCISLQERFRMTHQCRTAVSPQPLLDAYARAGTVWRGTDAIKTWEATSMPSITTIRSSSSSSASMPPIMIMRGEHDFVTEECFARWKEIFHETIQQVRFRVLKGCSHHGLLEDSSTYGEVLDSFFAEFD